MKYIKIIAMVIVAILTVNGQEITLSSGSIKRIEKFPSKFVEHRPVVVWLPDGYTNTKKYAVLYMHDGASLFDSLTTWNKQEWGVDETVSKLISEKKIKDCIVVGIYNLGAKRHAEYFPRKPFDLLSEENKAKVLNFEDIYNNRKLMSGVPNSDNYLKFIVNELKPYIDSNYSTLTDVRNTFIAGSSMGGLISMYAICEYPNVFGGAACISIHWPGIRDQNDYVPEAFVKYLKNSLPKLNRHKLYFDYGTVGLDSLYKVHQAKVDELMNSSDAEGIIWETLEVKNGNHTENDWKRRLNIPFEFLLEK